MNLYIRVHSAVLHGEVGIDALGCFLAAGYFFDEGTAPDAAQIRAAMAESKVLNVLLSKLPPLEDWQTIHLYDRRYTYSMPLAKELAYWLYSHGINVEVRMNDRMVERLVHGPAWNE